MLRRLVTLILATCFGAIFFLTIFFYLLVVFGSGEEISQGNIEKILAVESPVYYADGTSKVGVFFESAHRQYIPYEKIPRDFVNAIVSAEDRNFFYHHGIDFMGILRAMAVNLRAGRIVQGGSTITQQTAKNLFKRKDRSIGAKIKELVYALRLEYHYPKEKILEFYANQFYVSGNGRGLGVAARYYFDKDASDLNLIECAFIAGSVKKPNFYNPFIKNSPEEAARAREKSRLRVAYVLRQMYRNHLIDKEALDASLGQEIPFRQGKMTYSLNTVMDMVKEALTDPGMEDILKRHGIDNIATSGIRVITTIEKGLQEKTLYALRKDLSRLSVRLGGYDHKALQEKYSAMSLGGNDPKVDDFLLARVVSVDPAAPAISVSLSAADAIDGVIDLRGIRNVLASLVKYERELWSTPSNGDLARFVKSFVPGELVFVSVRQKGDGPGQMVFDLEKYPEIQGAALAYRDGSIRSMAGGFENRFFNRAIYARRPMGSVMKPLVYAAAIQLGWNSMDILDNRRDVFVFQGQPYFPRPDHESPFSGVSMSWAGVHSENVATVWLLYHLCDHLSPAQFREVLESLGLERLAGEEQSDYRARIRDAFGIVVDRPQLYMIAFDKAVASLEPDLIFSGLLDEYEILRTLHYGYGFDRFDEAVDEALGLEEQQEEELAPREQLELKKKEEEAAVRHEILRRNYLRFAELYEQLAALRDSDILEAEDADEIVLYQDRASSTFFVSDREGIETADPLTRADLALMLDLMDAEERQEFWQGIKLDNAISISTFETLAAAVEAEYEKLAELDAYSPEILYQVRDFRVMASLLYLTGLCREMGIESKLDPVLSFPLGSNVITPLEVARAYEALVTGEVVTRAGGAFSDGLAIIKRIEDSDGDVIYEATPERRKVISPEVSLEISDILRNVVKYGTGRYADRKVRLASRDPEKNRQLAELDLKVPVAGKTGTANRFTNASFAGIIPGIGHGNIFSLADGYVLATYVGYDDNKPMVRTSSHITGAAGALPMWSRIANTILLENDYAANLDLVDITFSGLSTLPLAHIGSGYLEVPVDAKRGGVPTSDPSGVKILTYGEKISGGRVKPSRFFRPYWRVEGNSNDSEQ